MTFREVVKRLARRLKYPHPETLAFSQELIKEIAEVLEEGKEVKVQGLGTFFWRKIKGRDTHVAGRRVITQDGWKLKFRPSTKLRGKRCQKMTKE